MATPFHDGTMTAPDLDPPIAAPARRAGGRRPPARSGAHRLPSRDFLSAVPRVLARFITPRAKESAAPDTGR